ncbi:hypothetical protein EDB83DRAFT_2524301 [Lactarius deliciosus]|nr:hypothetical protein EDB83DRAFT_2524301 [Lactarius deliciosus]
MPPTTRSFEFQRLSTYPYFLPPLPPPLFHITAKTKTHWRDSDGPVRLYLKGYPTNVLRGPHSHPIRLPSSRDVQATPPPTLCPTAATPRTLSPSLRHHLNTPDSDGATSTPTSSPSRRHLDTPPTTPTHVPPPSTVTASTATITAIKHHPPMPATPPQQRPARAATRHATSTTTATDHHPRQQRHGLIDPTRRAAINTATPPSPPLPTTTHASNATASSTRPAALPSTPPPRPHVPRHRSNTTALALALAPHQPHPAQPPWTDLVLISPQMPSDFRVPPRNSLVLLIDFLFTLLD